MLTKRQKKEKSVELCTYLHYILQKCRLVLTKRQKKEKSVCYSTKKRESCSIELRSVCFTQKRERSCLLQHKKEEKAWNLLQFVTKWAQIMSFLPNHVPDITTSVLILISVFKNQRKLQLLQWTLED